MAFKRPDPSAPAPVPPTPNGSDPAQGQFAEIEQLQLLIIEEQVEILASVENLKVQSILLLDRVRGLESMANNECIPELEKIIKAVSKSATKIDEKVPDRPPTTPPIRPPPSSGTRP